MLINPAEADHEKLYRAITSAFKRLQAEDVLDADTEADIEKIATLAQAILKREWVRVKQGV